MQIGMDKGRTSLIAPKQARVILPCMKTRLVIAATCAMTLPLAAADRIVQNIPGAFSARLSGYCKSITEAGQSAVSGDFRVRRGGSLTASGNRHTIFVDEGASVTLTGQASTVFVARGGQATIGGTRNQVFAELGGRLTILGQAAIATVGELDLKLNRNADECR
jgi:hypothetical protein